MPLAISTSGSSDGTEPKFSLLEQFEPKIFEPSRVSSLNFLSIFRVEPFSSQNFLSIFRAEPLSSSQFFERARAMLEPARLSANFKLLTKPSSIRNCIFQAIDVYIIEII